MKNKRLVENFEDFQKNFGELDLTGKDDVKNQEDKDKKSAYNFKLKYESPNITIKDYNVDYDNNSCKINFSDNGNCDFYQTGQNKYTASISTRPIEDFESVENFLTKYGDYSDKGSLLKALINFYLVNNDRGEYTITY
jgi:hypothetical protein